VADVQTIEIPPLQDVPSVVEQAPPPVVMVGPVVKPPVSRRPYAYAAGAVGLASLGLGSYFGVEALQKSSDVKTACPGGSCTQQADVNLASTAKTYAIVSDVMIGSGLAFVAAGTFLFFTEPRVTITPMVGRVSGLTIQSSW